MAVVHKLNPEWTYLELTELTHSAVLQLETQTFPSRGKSEFRVKLRVSWTSSLERVSAVKVHLNRASASTGSRDRESTGMGGINMTSQRHGSRRVNKPVLNS